MVQRVSRAQVRVEDEVVGSIARGLLVLVGVTHGDTAREAEVLARKIVGLRIFDDADGKMNLSLAEAGGALLAVSQFTLYADVRRGRRPSFTDAAPPAEADALYQYFCRAVATQGIAVGRGRFGAHMAVDLVNDGPVTILLDTAQMAPG